MKQTPSIASSVSVNGVCINYALIQLPCESFSETKIIFNQNGFTYSFYWLKLASNKKNPF